MSNCLLTCVKKIVTFNNIRHMCLFWFFLLKNYNMLYWISGFGCALEPKHVLEIIKRPIGPGIGMVCQFIFMAPVGILSFHMDVKSICWLSANLIMVAQLTQWSYLESVLVRITKYLCVSVPEIKQTLKNILWPD